MYKEIVHSMHDVESTLGHFVGHHSPFHLQLANSGIGISIVVMIESSYLVLWQLFLCGSTFPNIIDVYKKLLCIT